jgi:flagellar protein FliT
VERDRRPSRRASAQLNHGPSNDSTDRTTMNSSLLSYYEAIEKASADMLDAARAGNWDHVIKLEGACVLLISQLKNAARSNNLSAEESQLKSRIMKRILVNDAEIRHLAEPWLEDLDHMMAGKPKTLH